jgi:GNAT superfamily N-acetyltransferase
VIANEKGKGYGKKVMTAIREYLVACDQTGLGFCWPHNQGFYEKCGFTVETKSTHRFVYHNGEEEQTAEGQVIFYLDSSERFMEKILAEPCLEISVPDPGIW